MSTASAYRPPLDFGVRLQLSIMMLLQFAIWGAWFTVFGNRIDELGLTAFKGSLYGTMALGTIFAPLIVGQIADRYFPSQILMAILHLAGAGVLYVMATWPTVTVEQAKDLALYAGRPIFWWVCLGYALLYSPTLALSNSIAFTHIPDATRDFPGVRVFGTIGWILVGLGVSFVLGQFVEKVDNSNAPLLLAAGLSAALGLFSFVLPHTPPPGKAGDAFPFLRAVGLLKNWSFFVFFMVAAVMTLALPFYYNFTGTYLGAVEKGGHIGVPNVAATMTIGQISEMVILPLLPVFLWRFGIKWVLAIGMLCWAIRYAIFSYVGGLSGTALAPDFNNPYFLLVLLGVALHGPCFDFFFAAGFIHVDNESPPEIRGSAQALFTFLTYGLAMWLGSEISNWWSDPTQSMAATLDVTGKLKLDWFLFWLAPSVGAFAALVLFVAMFRYKKRA